VKPDKTNGRKTILLVEDEALIAAEQKLDLQEKGYDVIHALSGKKAVQTALTSENNIDLILMDINLGRGIDGTEAARMILEKQDIPIVFVSSHTEKNVVEKTEKITSYGYVVKNSGIVVLDASIKMAFKLFEAKKIENQKEAALRESEKHYKTLVEQSSDAIYVLLEDKYSLVNNAFARMFGYTKKEILSPSFNFWKIVAPESKKMIEKRIKDRESGAKISSEYEFKGITKTGLRIDLEATLIDIFWDGNPAIQGIYRDITERKQSEERLCLLSSVVEQSTEGMAVADLNGNLTFVNDAWRKMHGYQNSDKLLGKNLSIFHTEEQLANDVRPINLNAKKYGTYTAEVGHITKDGRLFQTSMVTTLLKDNDGNPAAWVGLARDISARKQAEQKLKDTKGLLEKTFNAIPDLLTVHDRNLNIVQSNWHGHEYVTREERESNPKCYSAYMHRDKPCDPCHAVEVFRTGKAMQLIKTNKVDGIIREINLYPVLDDNGSVIMVTEHIRDITERMQAGQILLNERQRLAGILKGTNSGTWEWNIETGETIYNERWAEIIGYTLEELSPISIKTWEKFMHPEDLITSNCLLESHLEGKLDYYECHA